MTIGVWETLRIREMMNVQLGKTQKVYSKKCISKF